MWEQKYEFLKAKIISLSELLLTVVEVGSTQKERIPDPQGTDTQLHCLSMT